MIYLTKKTGERIRFLLNHRLIEQVHEHERKNGTIITLRDGKKIIIEESMSVILEAVQKYEAEVMLLFQMKKEEEPRS